MKTITETAFAPGSAGGSIGRGREQSRARYPDAEGFVEREGQRLFYEVYGEGEETLFLIPTWSLAHFEQNFHVRHRLERYGAGRRMDFDDSPPQLIAAAIAQEIGREVDYRDVEVDGAARAARRLAELL
jgi:hypothetical protein